MKKLLIVFFLIFSISSLGNIEVDAANICTATKYNELKREAYKATVSWELKFDEKNSHYFEVTVSNMNSSVILKFGDAIYESKEDGSAFKINARLNGGNTYEFNFYGGYDHPCVEEYVYTKRLEIPNYNKYSELDDCIEYEEFPLCNKWYSGTIEDEDYFYEKLEIYKKSLEKPIEPAPTPKEKKIFEKIIDFYIENIAIALPITILIVILTIILIVVRVRRAKRRVKIDFNV